MLSMYELLYHKERWSQLHNAIITKFTNQGPTCLDFDDWASSNISWLAYLVPSRVNTIAIMASGKAEGGKHNIGVFVTGKGNFDWGQIKPIELSSSTSAVLSSTWLDPVGQNVGTLFPFQPHGMYKDGWSYRLCFYGQGCRAVVDFDNPDNEALIAVEAALFCIAQEIIISGGGGDEAQNFLIDWDKARKIR
jgi:hypothetical protein